MQFEIEHIGLAARDTVALKDWYVRVLGGKVVFDNGQSPPAFLVSLSGSPLIEIYPAEFSVADTGKNSLQGWRHLALRVESLEAARQTLEERGVAISEPVKPAGGGGRVLFFRDAEGNLLHLVERRPGGFQR